VTRGYMLEAMAAGPEYAAAMVPGTGRHVFDVVHRYANLAGFGVMLIDTPSPENRIELDASGRPAISYALSDADARRLRAALADAVRIMFRAGARRVFVPTHENIYTGSTAAFELTRAEQVAVLENDLRFLPNATILTSAHLQASDKMGSLDAGAVVDTAF